MRIALFCLLLLSACGQQGESNFPRTGYTYLSVGPGHGVQIFYLEQGEDWLWYPFNAKAVRSTWRILPASKPAICWTPPEGTRNPVTGTRGGVEGCELLGDVARRVVQSRQGDVFNLRSGDVPSRRGRCEVPPPFDPLPGGAC